MRGDITVGLLQRILFGEGNRYLEENEFRALEKERNEKLFSAFITVNKAHPPTEDLRVDPHFLQEELHATEGPQRKHRGRRLTESALLARREEVMGSGGTCAGTESLIHLIDDRPVSTRKLTIDGT